MRGKLRGDLYHRIFTHGNAKSLGEKLSARQYQSIHKCAEFPFTPVAGVFTLEGKKVPESPKFG